MTMCRLKGQRVYLAGAMDRALDRGIGWRNEITPFLENLGVTVFNPLTKPTEVGMEDVETHAHKTKLNSQKDMMRWLIL